MLLQMMNDNTYKYKDAYDNDELTDPSGNMHFGDKYKTAYHPTFSNESKFSGKKSEENPEGIIGGRWSNDWRKYYVGDRIKSKYFNQEQTKRYLKMSEDYPVEMIYDFGKSIPMFATGTDNNFAGDLVARLGGGDKAQ